MLNFFYRSVAKSEMNLLAIKNRIDIYLKKGNERNVLAKRNIIASFGIKIIGIIISLILVPMTVNYVSSAQYGLWLTISSIVAWISYFDFGFAHGFRNRFTEAMALNDRELAKQYVSTTYAVLTIIFVTMAFVVLVINSFLDWSSLLNVGLEYGHELAFSFCCTDYNTLFEYDCKCVTNDANRRPKTGLFIFIYSYWTNYVFNCNWYLN